MDKKAVLEAMFEQCRSDGNGLGIRREKVNEKGAYFTILFPRGTHFQSLLAGVAGAKLATTQALESDAKTFLYEHDQKIADGTYRQEPTHTLNDKIIYPLAEGIDLELSKTSADEYTVRVYDSFIKSKNFVEELDKYKEGKPRPSNILVSPGRGSIGHDTRVGDTYLAVHPSQNGFGKI